LVEQAVLDDDGRRLRVLKWDFGRSGEYGAAR